MMALHSHKLVLPTVVRLHRALSVMPQARQRTRTVDLPAPSTGGKSWDNAAEFAVVKLEDLVVWARRVRQ